MEERKYQIPLIGDIAPSFKTKTTLGEIDFPKDYKGKWVVLFSHPADFTPVCTTEFISFQNLKNEFDKRDTELIGYSMDGLSSHIAWVLNIKEKFDVDIEFPIATGMDIAIKYGMIHPNSSLTATIRAVFVISPGGVIAALIYYPLTNGRSIEEILRLLDSLQLSYNKNVSTPADWPNNQLYKDMVISPPPSTVADAKKIIKQNSYTNDWYINTKKIN